MHEVINTIIDAISLFVIKEMSECRLLFNSNEFPSRVNACKEIGGRVKPGMKQDLIALESF